MDGFLQKDSLANFIYEEIRKNIFFYEQIRIYLQLRTNSYVFRTRSDLAGGRFCLRCTHAELPIVDGRYVSQTFPNYFHMSKPTNGELEILRVLWKDGPSSVRFVNEQLSADRTIGYTTTLKLMQIMHDKGFLSRTRSGKTHIYRADVTEEETQQQLVDRLLDTAFSGSAMKLVMQALGNRRSSPEELAEIRQFLDQLESDQSESTKS